MLLVSLRATPTEPPTAPGVRRAVQSAIRSAGNAPEHIQPLEAALVEAERVTAEERARPWWRWPRSRSGEAWLRTAIAAREVARETERRGRLAATAYSELLARTAEEVDRGRREMQSTGMARREAESYRRAELLVSSARELATLKRWEEASAKPELSRQHTDQVHGAWLALHTRFRNPALRRQWQRWADETIRRSRETGEPALLVDKYRRRLVLYRGGDLAFSFPAELGANGWQPKSHAGDLATPEGMYRVVELRQGRRTAFYKSLMINYPNRDDQTRFAARKRRGEIPNWIGIGSLIAVHGEGGLGRDWTDGCVALRNDHMDEVFAHAQVGTPVTIVGTYD